MMPVIGIFAVNKFRISEESLIHLVALLFLWLFLITVLGKNNFAGVYEPCRSLRFFNL